MDGNGPPAVLLFVCHPTARSKSTSKDYRWGHAVACSSSTSFVQSGEYEVRIRLARDRDEHVEGLHEDHKIDLLLDRDLIQRFTIVPVKQKPGQSYEMIDHSLVDKHLVKRFTVPAGPHKLGVTFVRRGMTLSKNKREPFHAAFNRHRHPRPEPAVFEVSIVGPFDPQGPGDTPSRRRVFARFPKAPDQAEEQACAEASLRRLLRFAYRRPPHPTRTLPGRWVSSDGAGSRGASA